MFDPGSNALSIVTRILPRSFFVTDAELDFRANCDAPIAARIAFADGRDLPLTVDFDFRQTARQIWEIAVETASGALALHDGGGRLVLPDGTEPERRNSLHGEYAGLYRRFVEIIGARQSDVDIAPFRHVTDAFLQGRRIVVEPFVA